MPARAFVDSDNSQSYLYDSSIYKSKCPRGHLLILMRKSLSRDWGAVMSKCPRGHLLILIILKAICMIHLYISLNAREGIC